MSNKHHLYAGKLFDLGNYYLTGLVLGHVLLRETHSSTILIIGFGGFALLHGIALFIIMKEE